MTVHDPHRLRPQRGTSVTVLDPHEMGQVVLTVLGMVAQMERRFIRNRQKG